MSVRRGRAAREATVELINPPGVSALRVYDRLVESWLMVDMVNQQPGRPMVDGGKPLAISLK